MIMSISVDGLFSNRCQVTVEWCLIFQYKVHQGILSLAVSEVDWSQEPPPLSGLPEDVLYTILYYVYAECLPKGLSEETARSTVEAVSKLPGFTKLTQLCETFLKNTALRQREYYWV